MTAIHFRLLRNMNKFNIVGIFLFLPIFCSKGRKVFLVRSGLGGEEGDANGTELRYATHKQTDPGKSYKRDSFSCYTFISFLFL